MSEIFERLMKKRGINEKFLNPRYEDLTDAEKLIDGEKAMERIKLAKDRGEKVLVFGDYDADGVTASAVMAEGLEMAGITGVEIMLPDRFRDGYGMNEGIIEKVKEGISLVITVDCGSANAEIVKKLNEIGVDVIVTDHHECPEKLPEAVAVINPKRMKDGEEGSELKELAGVGVAFFLVRLMAKRGMIEGGREKWLLDLVAIGTICDSMVLLNDNRILAYYGMIVLNKTRRVGLKELMRVAGTKVVNSEAVGFQIGPRINAAGRMRTAEIALELVRTKSKVRAAKLAKELDELNYIRKEEQKKAVELIEQAGQVKDDVIVAEGDFSEGVIGIIAGKLCEDYKKPAFVFTFRDGVCKGSGRSFGEFNLKNALDECNKLIIGGGGHAAACGVKVAKDGLEEFRRGVNEYYKELKLVNQERFLEIPEDVATEEVGGFDLELMEEIEKLEPFGVGNNEPVFLLKDVLVLNTKVMGQKGEHLSLYVRGSDGENIKLLAFYAPEEWMEVEKGMRVDVKMQLVNNEWNGLTSVEGRIVKLVLVSEGEF